MCSNAKLATFWYNILIKPKYKSKTITKKMALDCLNRINP